MRDVIFQELLLPALFLGFFLKRTKCRQCYTVYLVVYVHDALSTCHKRWGCWEKKRESTPAEIIQSQKERESLSIKPFFDK